MSGFLKNDLTVGNNILGGATANGVLFADGSNLLSNESGFTWDGAALTISDNSVKFRISETDAASNEKTSQLFSVGGQLRWGIFNDNLSGEAIFMALDRTANVADKLSWTVPLIAENGLTRTAASVSLADDAEVTFETGKAGWGECQIGDDQEWARFTFTSAGVVTLKENSTNVVNTDTDANLCIYDAGSGIAIKNRLGSELTLRYRVEYS